MRKIVLALIAIFISLTINAVASNVGDKITTAVYSDITAYINNHPMPCYVIDGFAVVVAEDLRNYCCDVYFDETARTLNITKSSGSIFTNPIVYKTVHETGEFYVDVLYTDIKTFVNGKEVKSFNVDGKTMIVIDEFGKCMDGYEYIDSERAAKAYLEDKPQAEFKKTLPRTITLFEQRSSNYTPTYYFTADYDFDFDGNIETLTINAENTEYSQLKISLDEIQVSYEVCFPSIDAVYVCDIDVYDESLDIAVSVNEMGWSSLFIFSLDEEVNLYEFESYDIYGDGTVEKSLPLYCDSFFRVNDNGTITVRTKTTSPFWWNVERTYQRDMYGIFREITPVYYEIQPEYMQAESEYRNVYGYEKTMWDNGYIKAYADYSDNGVIIKKGEYFKVLYDNDNNYIYIEKENGQAGWIYCDEFALSKVNFYFFAF